MTIFKASSTGHYVIVLDEPFIWAYNVISMAGYIYSTLFFIYYYCFLSWALEYQRGRKTITHFQILKDQ